MWIRDLVPTGSLKLMTMSFSNSRENLRITAMLEHIECNTIRYITYHCLIFVKPFRVASISPNTLLTYISLLYYLYGLQSYLYINMDSFSEEL